MKSLLTVFSYGGADDMIDRHYPSWLNSGCDILLSFPVDDPCKRGGLAFNKSEHHGPCVMDRIFQTFRHVLKFRYETFYFIEADSICLGEAPAKLAEGLHCYKIQNSQAEFKASHYCHWMWGMNQLTLTRISSASNYYDPREEQGYCDRFMGMLCEDHGIDIIHRPDLAYSRNRLDTKQYIREAKLAIGNGVKFLHGIKTQEDLNNIMA